MSSSVLVVLNWEAGPPFLFSYSHTLVAIWYFCVKINKFVLFGVQIESVIRVWQSSLFNLFPFQLGNNCTCRLIIVFLIYKEEVDNKAKMKNYHSTLV